MFCFDRFI